MYLYVCLQNRPTKCIPLLTTAGRSPTAALIIPRTNTSLQLLKPNAPTQDRLGARAAEAVASREHVSRRQQMSKEEEELVQAVLLCAAYPILTQPRPQIPSTGTTPMQPSYLTSSPLAHFDARSQCRSWSGDPGVHGGTMSLGGILGANAVDSGHTPALNALECGRTPALNALECGRTGDSGVICGAPMRSPEALDALDVVPMLSEIGLRSHMLQLFALSEDRLKELEKPVQSIIYR